MDRQSAYTPFYVREGSTAHLKVKKNASDPPPGSIFIELGADTVGAFGGGRRKRNEAERIACLSQDAYVAQLEPHRVLCRGCCKWIRLRANTTYCTSPWALHKASCFPKNGLTG
ncbi:hypothetical protein MKEN_00544600 [Mycena kentingensis (nom. inval.)]|nr:hypothetical protein MKEN_00544600 [Mycena kentingensis (nom. inval.)]